MKAVFLDRDGVINELVYYPERGVRDSPFTAEQFKLIPGVAESIRRLHEMGYKVILASNQPGIANRYMSRDTFNRIRKKMNDELVENGGALDGEYYCFHHPEAKIERLKANCKCKKPKPGLLIQAANDMNIDLSQSWMIGDRMVDVEAGKSAGTKTILVGVNRDELHNIMDEEDKRPDYIASNLSKVVNCIANWEANHGNIY